MNKIKVSIINITPEEVLIKAVSMPYDNPKADLELCKKIGIQRKHYSILEHVNVSFQIDGYSRGCLQELMRHRTASSTVKSTRYTLKKMLNDINILFTDIFITPKKPELTNEKKWNKYIDCLTKLNKKSIEYMRKMSKLGFSNDYLKYFIVENFRSSHIWTCDFRNILHFLQLRLDNAAHFEIRHIAEKIKEELDKTYLKPFIEEFLKSDYDKLLDNYKGTEK